MSTAGERPEANPDDNNAENWLPKDPVVLETTAKTSAAADDNQPALFPVSENKLITLYILSFGIYGFYWFYKNWQLQQKTMDKKIYPLLRAIFSIFFTHSLFKRIDRQASHLEKQYRFNAGFLATLFVASVVLDTLIDGINTNTTMLYGTSNSILTLVSLSLFFLSLYPLVKVQGTANRINNDILGFLNHRYTWSNYILIAFGVMLWLMFALGFLAESLGFVAPEQTI